MSKNAFITVKCGEKEVHIKSHFNAQISLPDASGHLIDFDQLKINVNSHVLVKYWAGCEDVFNQKLLSMFQKTDKFSYDQFKVELVELPYVQLFIMSIIKSDVLMFDRLYPFITTCDLEICRYISQYQFPNIKICKWTQSILTLFRHTRTNTIQNTMLNAILKKMTVPHIVYQIYMMECDKYNIPMYNIALLHMQRSITHELKINKGKNPKIQNPIWQIKYKPLAAHQMREMSTCRKLNPSLSDQSIADGIKLPRSKKDYSEFLGLTIARPIEYSWPI